jgi:hypothetical protein
VADRLSRNRWLVAGVFSFFLLPLLVGIGAIAALMYIAGNLGLAAWPFALGAIALGYLAWRRYRSEGAEPALLRASAASILLVVAIYGFVFPAMRPLFPAVMAAEAVRGSGCADPQAVMAGFEEPSYVFLLGTRTQFMDPYGAIHFLQGGPCRFALIDARWEASVLQRAQLLGLKMQVLPRIEGFNPSHGNRLTILVYRSPD